MSQQPLLQRRPLDVVLLGLGICSTPLSIAAAELFLAAALVIRLMRVRGKSNIPRLFWFWFAWAGLELISWFNSPSLPLGLGEVKHLLLIAAMFLLLTSSMTPERAIPIWRGLFITSTVGSAFLIGNFTFRLCRYQRELAATPDPSLYLRTGGLLHHWMVYGTVEVLVLAGMIEFWSLFPETRRRLAPALAINTAAICLSLTRMLWIAAFAVLAFHLLRRRSKWIFALPLLPIALWAIAPTSVRLHVMESIQPGYYSNVERIQMLDVGLRMIRDFPLLGVGPGRIEPLYISYLPHDAFVPAFHGHLHNNMVQLTAEFGIPVTLAASIFTTSLWMELWRLNKAAVTRCDLFLTRTALSGLVGFITAGFFEYTYGHALGLILLTFVALTPAVIASRPRVSP